MGRKTALGGGYAALGSRRRLRRPRRLAALALGVSLRSPSASRCARPRRLAALALGVSLRSPSVNNTLGKAERAKGAADSRGRERAAEGANAPPRAGAHTPAAWTCSQAW